MNTFYFTKHAGARILAIVALFSLVLGMLPMQTFAAHDAGGPYESEVLGGNSDRLLATIDKIRICHSTSSQDNPYTNPDVNIASFFSSGHDRDLNDIIPPFHYTQDGITVLSFAGTNWNSGESTWENGCVAPVAPTTGTLTISKVISGIGGVLTSAFSFVVNGGSTVAFQADGSNDVSVNAGAYNVVESGVTAGEITVGPNTYSVGYSAGCASTMIAGGTANCTITNTFVPPAPTTGTIVVNKITNPSADTTSFAFTTTGTGYVGFSLTDAAAPNSQTVEAGTYSVAETAVAGWTQNGVSCVSSIADTEVASNLELDANETITCTFTNTLNGAPVVNGCTDVNATNYNRAATPGNPDAADCDFDYVSVCPLPVNNLPVNNLLTNASFEDPVVDGANGTAFGGGFYGVFASITDWSATNSIELWNNILNLASDGDQSTELDVANSSTISQTATTIPGATYELRFDFAARSDNSSASENSVIATADGNPVVTASTNNTAFTTYGATFVAGDASTTVSFADNGVSNGSGTVIDNAVLCLVQAPVPNPGTLDVVKMVVGTTTVDESAFSFKLDGGATTTFETDGTNSLALVAGTYDVVETSAPGYTTTYSDGTDANCDDIVVTAGQTSTCTITNTLIVAVPQVCEVNVVSDLSNTVNATGTVIVGNQPGAWVDNIVDSVAQWIWGSAGGSAIDPVTDESQTFTKTFIWNGPVTSATLQISADNYYSVTLNGVELASTTDEFNYSSIDTIDLSGAIAQGTNTLEITATNLANGATNLSANPAGLMYDLTVVGNTSDDCDTVPNPNPSTLSCTITVDDAVIRRGGDVTLTWSSIGAVLASLDGATTTTAGQLLVEDIDSDTTYTLTVTDAQNNDATCSVSVDTRSGGGGGGGNSLGGGNNDNDDDDDRDGEVLGASDDREPLVLGEQVSAVPLGAADAGAGSTAPNAVELSTLAPVAFLRRKA